MAKQRKHLNLYITTTLSITLVLLLVGMQGILLLTIGGVVKQVKENVSLEIVLKNGAEQDEINRLKAVLDVAKFCKDYTEISQQQALEEHILYLGEDPTKFLNYNPLHASIEVHLNQDYAVSDSIKVIEQKLLSFESVEAVNYQENVVDVLNKNIGYLSLILLSVAAVLLLISISLINNTIQLTVYSKRFLINTMKLVGATSWFIKRPIIATNVLIGIIASLISTAILAGVVYYLKVQLNIILFPLTLENILFVVGTIFVVALLITYIASAIAANRYIRMKTNDLYSM